MLDKSAEQEFVKVIDENPLITRFEYTQLVPSFDVESNLIDGLNLLRVQTGEKKVEVGGVIYIDSHNTFKIATTLTGESNAIEIGYNNLTLENIEEHIKLDRVFRLSPESHRQKNEIFFATTTVIEKYPHFFKQLTDWGNTIITDGKPVAPVHSHPSGNLPSNGDFCHVLIPGFDSETNKPEVVVTAGWVHMLIPTKETPSLHEEDPFEFIQEMNREEDEILQHLQNNQQNSSVIDKNAMANAVKQKLLLKYCRKYNVGYYVLPAGKTTANLISR